jgi:hypothetical protein
LLKELGWNDDLIRHFMVTDSGETDRQEDQTVVEVFDSHSMMLTFNAENSGSLYVVKG